MQSPFVFYQDLFLKVKLESLKTCEMDKIRYVTTFSCVNTGFEMATRKFKFGLEWQACLDGRLQYVQCTVVKHRL